MAKNFYAMANTIHVDHPTLEWISGKWFEGGVEIKDIKKWIISRYARMVNNPNDTRVVCESYIEMYGDTEGYWYEMPIVEEARRYKKKHPMAFPLNEKQLKIIRVLLEGKEEAFFIVTGVGGSGKSTFGNIVKQIFENDVAYLDLGDLSNSFTAIQMSNKRLVYSEELNAEKLNNGKIKTYTSHQVCTFNGKNQQPFSARCQSSFLFNCNVPPIIDVEDTGMLRRIVYYSMNKRVENVDVSLAKKLWDHEELVNIVRWALDTDIEGWKKDFEEETHFNLLKGNSVYKLRGFDNYIEYRDACYIKGYKPFCESSWNEIKELIKEWWPYVCEKCGD